jgi:transcriptional antiterminator
MNKYFQRAKLNLCDLAGSEKINKEEEMNKMHFLELKTINQSLTTLGKVIQSLAKSDLKSRHKNNYYIAYRESKITRLLQDSLGGNTRTCLIATVSPTT